MRLVTFLLLLKLLTSPHPVCAEAQDQEKPILKTTAWSEKMESLSKNTPKDNPGSTSQKPGSGWGKKMPGLLPADKPSDDEQSGAETEEISNEESTESPITLKNPGDWETVIEMDSQFFPSFLLATAIVKLDEEGTPEPSVIGDQDGMIGIAIKNPGTKTRISVEIHENLIMNAAKLEAVLEQENETYYIRPLISFKYDKLLQQKQPLPLSLNVSVTINGGEKVTRPTTVLIRSINDCPIYFVSQTDGSGVDISFLFASYVNESHPMIDVILQEALQTEIVNGFTGYQSNDKEEVLNQVFAIWTALQQRGIKYSSITTPSAHSENVFSQNVRFLDESLKYTQANCVDGSVLIASILYKIGVNPILVVLPDHMYIGFYLDENKENVCYLETTRLSDGQGMDNFNEMLDDTLAQYEKDADKFFQDDDPGYQFIDIAEARRLGIVPLAYSK